MTKTTPQPANTEKPQKSSSIHARQSKAKPKKEKRREKGTGSIAKRRKHFYLRMKIGDKEKYEMLRNPDETPCTTKEDAKKAADSFQKIMLADSKQDVANFIAEAKQLKRQSGLLLSRAWDTFLKQPTRPDCSAKTLTKYEMFFRFFIDWCVREHPEIELVSAVDREIASEFMRDYWNTGIAATTFNMCKQSLRLVFKNLMDVAALEENPFDGIQHKPNEVVSRNEFSAEQVKAIFDGFQTGFFYETEIERLTTGRARERVSVRKEYVPMYKDEMRVLLCLCCYTGCRGQDGALMTWRNIDLQKKIISFIPRKTARKTGGRAVTLPVAPDLLDALHGALAWRENNKPKEDYILPQIADCYKPLEDGSANPRANGIQKSVMKIIRCATGLETKADKAATYGRRKIAANAYGLHSFRHTFVSFCANAGVPYSVVASIVGHGNPAMTEHYSHITTESKRSAIQSLPSLAASVPQDDIVIDEPLSIQRKAIVDALEKADSKVLDEVGRLLKKRGLIN